MDIRLEIVQGRSTGMGGGRPGDALSYACRLLRSGAKGRGYPVALTEAHEHAVVRGPEERRFIRQ